MNRGRDVEDLTWRGDTAAHQFSARSETGRACADSPEGERAMHGMIATMVKGVFKIYLLPAMRARAALSTLTDGWSDLVAEARQESEARRAAEVLSERGSHAGVGASQPSIPAATAMERQAPESSRPITPGGAGMPQASGAKRKNAGAHPRAVTAPAPARSEPTQPDSSKTSDSPTLVETDGSNVEVRPDPAISPAHVTSDVVAHIPPEVHHKLAGCGPIRA
jgi:hypothetical protein